MEIRWIGINVGDGFAEHHHVEEGVYEFHFLLENGGFLANNGIVFPGKAGALFYTAPGGWHRAWVENPGQVMVIYSVSFLPEYGDRTILGLLDSRFSLSPEAIIGKGYSLVFEDMRRKVASGDTLQKRSADYRLVSFMYDVLGGQTRDHQPLGQMYVDEALNTMQSSLSTNLDMDRLVGRLGIDKSHFIRVFKQVMGVPPLKYYLGLKMGAAGHSLRESAKPVHLVAADFGYEDEHYFSRIFKTHMGVSPQDYRSTR